MRPALVLADLSGPDLILCQITSRPARDRYSVTVGAPDFSEGYLKYTSNVCANQIFTLEKTLIRNCIGRLKKEKTEQIVQAVISFLRS